MRVPFNRPYAGPAAERHVLTALRSDHHSGDGPFTREAAQGISEMAGGGRAFLTPSGTDALELACMAVGLGPGDEVIVPSFTFSSTATAVERQGATVRFADVDPITLSLTRDTVMPLVNERTKAVISVHYAGQGSDQEDLATYLGERGITLIEDAAHALGGRLNGRPYGSFGSLSCFSFHETKNLSCGEGGALVVNDPTLIESVEIIREKGTDRSRFFRGQVDKYTWVSPGSSFLLGEVLAAVLVGGLEDWDATQGNRHRVWADYASGLAGLSDAGFVLQGNLPGNEQPAHMFYLLAPSAEARDGLLDHCRGSGVLAVSHYQPLAESVEGRRASAPWRDDCPLSTDVSARLLRLPMYATMTPAETERVIGTVLAWSPRPA